MFLCGKKITCCHSYPFDTNTNNLKNIIQTVLFKPLHFER
jgi:hypothetical protein